MRVVVKLHFTQSFDFVLYARPAILTYYTYPKCIKCGACLMECPVLSLDKETAVIEISQLLDGTLPVAALLIYGFNLHDGESRRPLLVVGNPVKLFGDLDKDMMDLFRQTRDAFIESDEEKATKAWDSQKIIKEKCDAKVFLALHIYSVDCHHKTI